jgi:Protein of unknown function (DUF3050)
MTRYDWGDTHPGIERLHEAVAERRDRVVGHPLYAALDSHPAIVTFMEHHVFAVWDFMFELYLEGMAEAGATTEAIDALLAAVRTGTPVRAAIDRAGVPAPAAEFMRTTWGFIDTAAVHCQAAAFAFGREDLIPDMFQRVIAVNETDRAGKLDTFIDYLARHIEVDGEEHTPMAMQMLADLCGDDETKWRECADTVNLALAARSRLWDGILAAVKE